MTESVATSEWGHVAPDGTVYVRTESGDRAVGSWLAGSPEEGLAYYGRRYNDLDTEVGLLEQRARAAADPRAVTSAARRLLAALPTASVVGDIAALARRLEAVLASAEERQQEARRGREQARQQAEQRKRDLVAEAEQLAESSEWKRAGDRLREIAESWRELRIDRDLDKELWRRFNAARAAFNRRRGAHFAGLDEVRKQATARKEELATAAEGLVESTEWAATAARFRDLMTQWRAAGHAGRAADEALWARFRAAQNEFFRRRESAFAERDAEFRANLQVKRELLAEAEAIDVASGLDTAKRRLRVVQERWAKAGRVPREEQQALERRLAAVEERLRGAEHDRWRRVSPESSPLVVRLRESVRKLEGRLARAEQSGDAATAAEVAAALATQREWLEQAERSTR